MKELSNIFVILDYLRTDLIKKQRSFKIGLISIFLVVFFVALLMNVIELSPSIFLRLSEEQIGEADFIFTPYLGQKDVLELPPSFETLLRDNKEVTDVNVFSTKLVNFTELQEKLRNISFINGVAPRWLIQCNSTSSYENKTNWAVSNLIILDSELENQQGMGRKLHLPILNKGEAYVSRSLYRSLKLDLKEDKNITISMKPLALYKALQKLDINSAANLMQAQGAIPEEMQEPGKRRPKDQDEEESKGHMALDMESEGRFIKSLFKLANFTNITFTKKEIFELFNFPENFTISISLLKNPLIINIPYMKEFIDLINSKDFLLSQFLDIDLENDKISIKKINDNYTFSLNLLDQIDKISDEDLEEYLSIEFNLSAAAVVPQSSGKWPSSSGNVIAIDVNFINNYLNENMKRVINAMSKREGFKMISAYLQKYSQGFLKGFNLREYALTVNAVINNKFEVYQRVSSDLRVYVSDLAREIIEQLGYDFPIQIQTPIYTALATFEIGSVFLKDSFIAIMIFLWILSVLLVYSLMLGNVDERTYEFGMLRSLGFKKKNLTKMIILQGFIFAIPGVILGLTTCYIVDNYISFLLNWYSGLVMPFNLSWKNILLGTLSGLSIPLVSSYLPIKKALDANLKETLTIFNKKIGDLVVSMIKLENYGISLPSLISSIIIITIGFSTYYLAPLSLLQGNYSVSILIMTGILIIMLFGLIILFQLVIPKLQKFILKIIMLFAYKDRNIHFIVAKNLEGHHRRNKKVSIMFMIALGYIIFSGSIVNLVVSFVQTLSKSLIGGDAMMWIMGSASTGLNERLLDDYLNKTIQKFPGLIDNYTFVTYPLEFYTQGRVTFSTLNGYPRRRINIYGISESFVNSIQKDLIQITDYDRNLNYSYIPGTKNVDIFSMLNLNPNVPKIVEQSNNDISYPQNKNISEIYKPKMQINAIIAEGLRRYMGLSINEPCCISIRKIFNQKIPTKVVAMASKVPGFPSFSSYQSLASFSPVLISISQMKELLDFEAELYPDINETLSNPKVLKKSINGLAKIGVIIKFKEKSQVSMREMVYFEIKNLIEDDGAFSTFLGDIIKSANDVEFILNIILLILGLIALILSFFLIWTSFYSSIKENICEFGILRSIGLKRDQSTRMYLYEALCIILSSIITGTFLGFIISVTLILQFDAFAELPFKFNFPVMLYSTLSTFGLSLGMLGSYYPIYEVNQMSLVKIMKGLSY